MNNSPFELFRRNLKPAMIVLTLLAIFAFVVLPALQQYLQRNAGATGSTVVANYGGRSLTANRVNYFTRNHQSVVRFLTQLAQETIARGGNPRTANFVMDPNTGQIQSIGINSAPSYDATIRTLVYAAEAEKAGFELDDASLRLWLENFTAGMISESEMSSMLLSSTQNQMGLPHLYEQLRNHLLADVYLNRGVAGVFNGVQMGSGPLMTPAEQWDSFVKLNRSATVDTFGLLVNDYIDQTNDSPPEAEVAATYEAGKDRFPNDQSPEPAFRRRYAASFEYLVGDYKQFLAEEVAKLDEDAIRAEYDRRIAGGAFQLPEIQTEVEDDEMSLDAVESSDVESSDDTPKQPAADKPAGSEAAETEPASNDGANDQSSKSGEPETGEPETAEPETAEPETAEPETAEPETAEPETAEPETAEPETAEPETAEPETAEPETGEPETGDDQADSSADDQAAKEDQSNLSTKPVRLVALVAQEDQQAAEEADLTAETDAAGEQVAEAPGGDEEEATPKDSANGDPAESKPAENGIADDATEDERPANVDTTAAAEETPENANDEPKEPRVESYENVRQQIAETLAGPAARKRMDAAVTEIDKAMKLYFSQRSIHESNVLMGKAGEEPKRPNLAEMGERLGFKLESVDLIDQLAIVDEPISNSFEVGSQFGQRGPSFVVMMYGFDNGREALPPLEMFMPLRTADDPDGRMYVSWKVEQRDAYTPDLPDVRDEVVMVIRRKEALGLATEEAEEIAKRAAEAADKPLAEIVPADKKDDVKTNLGPFKWLDSFGFGVTIGNVEQLDSVGEAFMEAVFDSEVGQYSVAANEPQRVVYVIKPTKFEPSIEELRRQFKEPMNRRMIGMMDNGSNKIVSDFIKAVDERAGFESLIEEDQL